MTVRIGSAWATVVRSDRRYLIVVDMFADRRLTIQAYKDDLPTWIPFFHATVTTGTGEARPLIETEHHRPMDYLASGELAPPPTRYRASYPTKLGFPQKATFDLQGVAVNAEGTVPLPLSFVSIFSRYGFPFDDEIKKTRT